MKLPLVIAAILAALPGSAVAQTPAKQQPQAKQAPTQIKPKPVTTVPVRPAVQTPVDTAKAMEQAER
ncbi:hypothetical protein ABTK44_21425, partial [Acinetobacter baumannii]